MPNKGNITLSLPLRATTKARLKMKKSGKERRRKRRRKRGGRGEGGGGEEEASRQMQPIAWSSLPGLKRHNMEFRPPLQPGPEQTISQGKGNLRNINQICCSDFALKALAEYMSCKRRREQAESCCQEAKNLRSFCQSHSAWDLKFRV